MRGKIVETRPGLITVMVGQVEHTIEADVAGSRLLTVSPGDLVEIDPSGEVVSIASKVLGETIQVPMTPEERERFSAAWKHATTGNKP